MAMTEATGKGGRAMSASQAEQRVRTLAGAAAMPGEFDTWPGVLAWLPRVRRRRRVVRAVAAAGVAAVVVGVVVTTLGPGSGSASAAEVARRAASAARTGAGVPSFELTEITRTAPVGFQPEPPPPLVTEHISYDGPSRWRDESLITEPFGEGTQAVTQIRNGPMIATIAGGHVTINRATGQDGLPSSASAAWQQAALRKLLPAGSAGRCTPVASQDGHGPVIDGRPTVILRIGSSPCPSADFPQANGPAIFWLDRQTFLILRAELHGPGNQLTQTVTVTGLRYHVRFPEGTFRVPRAAPQPRPCPVVTSLPDLASLRNTLAYPPLLPASLPDGLRIAAIGSSGAMTSGCKLTTFTITYRDSSSRPAVQLYEAPQASASVRFPGTAVTIRPGLTGTLNSTSGMAILWWIQDGRYCALQSGGMTAGVRLTGVPAATLLRMAASLRR
jgi:hypothetical protein